MTGSIAPATRAPAPVALHPLLEAAFGALDGAGVTWCLLRGADDLGAPAGDVDLLVAPWDARRLGAILGPLGFARVPAWGYASHAFHVAYHAPTDRWLKLDVVHELAFGPGFSLCSDAAVACLARRRRSGSVSVLDDADAFWCLLLHAVLDDERPNPAAAAELRRLAAAPGIARSPLARELDGLAPPRPAVARLVHAARAGDWPTLAAARPALIEAWTRRERGATLLRRATAQVGRRARPLARARRGLTVALLGPDGAGKSTAATALERSFYFPVRVVYMSPSRPRQGADPPPGVGLALRIAAQLGRWLQAQGHRARGRLVVFDRYAYDALLPARRPLGRRATLRRRLLAHGCPPPQLTVVLDAPGELLHARKGEQDPSVLEAERQAYLEMARRRPRAAVLDASRGSDEVRRELTAAIWRAYGRRWNRRGGALDHRRGHVAHER